jgi:ABC1 atypical kinase-like domain
LRPHSTWVRCWPRIRERISDELDYELEAHQRRLERLFRGHPHVRLPRVHTDLSTRRVLVTEYVEGLRSDEIKQLGDAERDRIGEIAFRFYFGLVWRDGAVAGDPHPDNCVLCPDGRLCLLDFGLLRGLDAGYLEGERDVMRALAGHDPRRVHDGLSSLGYLPQPRAVDRDALFEHLATAGEWLLAQGFRRVDPAYVTQILGRGYPPRSPYFSLMRRLRMPPPMLLLRRWSSRFSRCSATCTPEPTGVRSPPSTIRASRPRLPSGARITPSTSRAPAHSGEPRPSHGGSSAAARGRPRTAPGRGAMGPMGRASPLLSRGCGRLRRGAADGPQGRRPRNAIGWRVALAPVEIQHPR